MKTIEPGTDPLNIQIQAWWVGKHVKCKRCNYVGEVEPGDEKKPGAQILAARWINGPRSIAIPCPTCGGVATWNNGK